MISTTDAAAAGRSDSPSDCTALHLPSDGRRDAPVEVDEDDAERDEKEEDKNGADQDEKVEKDGDDAAQDEKKEVEDDAEKDEEEDKAEQDEKEEDEDDAGKDEEEVKGEKHGVVREEPPPPQDCFFESCDQVSPVSCKVDVQSESDGEDDYEYVDTDARFFSFADGRPSNLRCVTFSGEQFLPAQQDDSDEEGRRLQPGRSSEYDIWMAEPTSVDERRRRLLQGMRIDSSRDHAAVLRACSRKAFVLPPGAADGAHASASKAPATEVSSSSSSLRHQKTIRRCCSGKELAMTRRFPQNPAEPALRRSSSAPPTLCNLLDPRPGTTDGAGAAAVGQGEGLGVSSRGVFRIKNLDTGKEFMVSEFSDTRDGSQISMDELEQVMRVNSGGGSCKQPNKDESFLSSASTKGSKSAKKKGSWLKNFKFASSSVSSLKTEKEKGEKSSGDSSSELMKVRQHGKSYKDLTCLYNTQEIHAHEGSIWCIKFSWDGRYLASAGVDRVVRVWQVEVSDVLSTPMPGQEVLLKNLNLKKSKKIKSNKRMHDYIVMPEVMFSLSKKSICALEGHSGDVLDLSWSKSQDLLSSSMDKTVRLWDIESKTCLKLFAHNDFVTSIQFNPVDDSYFISGSLDSKVRIWNVPKHHVVDWNDLHEMVTAASYTPDGQGALVGSHKGNLRLYNTSEGKLTQEGQIHVKKKKKPHAKKITGFQFAPGDPSEVLITSADSRIRVFNDLKLVHKFRAFRNTSSQIAASYTSDGKFVVCASEDSHVYIWKRQPVGAVSSGNKGKGWVTTRAHECFYCKDVSVAVPWPSAGSSCPPPPMPDLSGRLGDSQRYAASPDDMSHSKRNDLPPLPKKSFTEQELPEELGDISCSSPTVGRDSCASPVSDPGALSSPSISSSGRHNGADPSGAWGLVVVTAGLDGHIRVYQNFGLPLRLNLF